MLSRENPPTLLEIDTVSIAEAVQRDVDNCEEFEEQEDRESPYYATPEEMLCECSDLFCGKQYQDDAKIQKDIPLRKKKWAAFAKVAKAIRK